MEVGGFGFSMTAAGVSGMTLFAQPTNGMMLRQSTTPRRKKRRLPLKNEGESTGYLEIIAKTILAILIHKPLAAVNHAGRSGEDDLVIITPFNWNQASGRVHIYLSISLAVDD